jgi:hypothetical protein
VNCERCSQFTATPACLIYSCALHDNAFDLLAAIPRGNIDSRVHDSQKTVSLNTLLQNSAVADVLL